MVKRQPAKAHLCSARERLRHNKERSQLSTRRATTLAQHNLSALKTREGRDSVLREQNKKGEEHLQLPFSTRERPLIQSPALEIIACSQGDNQNLEDAIKAKGRRNTSASSPTNKTTMYRYTRCLTIHISGTRHTIPSSRRELSPPLRAPHSISPRLHLGREQKRYTRRGWERGRELFVFMHSNKATNAIKKPPILPFLSTPKKGHTGGIILIKYILKFFLANTLILIN